VEQFGCFLGGMLAGVAMWSSVETRAGEVGGAPRQAAGAAEDGGDLEQHAGRKWRRGWSRFCVGA